MAVIENFAELSTQEQQEFAAKLLEKINAENLLSDEVNFVIDQEGGGVEAFDFAGSLIINITNPEALLVPREATWQAADEDEAADDPGYDADFEDRLDNDIVKALKADDFDIDGYNITVQVDDVTEEETDSVEVTNTTEDDAGIGDYEYWGFIGHDSRPYVEVEGIITKACYCFLSLHVTPADSQVADVEAPVTENLTEAAEIKYEIWALGYDSDDDPTDHERYIGARDTYEEALERAKRVKYINDIFQEEDLDTFAEDEHMAVFIEAVKDKEIIERFDVHNIYLK